MLAHTHFLTKALWGLNRYWLCQTLLSSSPTLSEDPSLPVDCCLSKQPELHMDQFPLKQPSWHCVSAPWNTMLFSVLLKIVLCSHTQNSEMRRHNQPGQQEPFPPCGSTHDELHSSEVMDCKRDVLLLKAGELWPLRVRVFMHAVVRVCPASYYKHTNCWKLIQNPQDCHTVGMSSWAK